MKISNVLFSTFIIVLLTSTIFAQASNFSTSLHNNRQGKSYWYDAEQGGFFATTGVSIDDMGCKDCHGPADANGVAWDDSNPYPGAGNAPCNDCHANNDFSANGVSQDQCLTCHGRQKAEISKGFEDVHRTAGFVCWDCHTSGDVHGDGTEYNSMLEPGAIDADCEDCHGESANNPLPANHSTYDPHSNKIHCTSCHASKVITCYNCHLESQIEHQKRHNQLVSNFVLLVNRDKDDKVYPASFQSITYQGNAHVAFGPFSAHTITAEGRDCEDCHNNDNVQNYNANNEIKLATWSDADSALTTLNGIVPIPHDYETTLKMDFITWNGAPDDPTRNSKNWSSIGKDTWDAHQLLFATALTEDQMDALVMDVSFAKNFETSLHNTRNGKPFWYNKENGGFETLTNVPIEHENLACTNCHGSMDGEGIEYNDNYQYPGPSCQDCHTPTFEFQGEQQCFKCHGRQGAEKSMYDDVHRTAGMGCEQCHMNQEAGVDDLHGDGTEYNSMLEVGAIKADCENCHIDVNSTPPLPDHSSVDPHGGDLHCNACHSESVVSCYNCHFESQVEHHVKRAKTKIKDFVILVNRQKDGKVGTASFQSLTYDGNSWIAMAPYHGHTVKKGGRTCSDCHANPGFGGDVASILDYNDDGTMQFASWDDDNKVLTNLNGVVPLPVNYEDAFKMDFITFDGDPSSPPGPSDNWSFVKNDADGFKLRFATPMSKEQMAKLGFDTTKTVTDVKSLNELPVQYRLEQNYPNPFNPSTTIKYSIPQSSRVQLKVYDIIGNLVETLVDENQNAGVYTVDFNASNLSSGVYFYQIVTPTFEQTRKLVLLK